MPARHLPLHSGRRQRGASLLEALIASLVLGLGAFALARAQPQLSYAAELARQHAEATRLAQSEAERLRERSRTPAATAAASEPQARRHLGSAAAYDIAAVAALSEPQSAAAAARVGVRWADRSGATREVALGTLPGPEDPRHSAALGLAHPGSAGVAPFGRVLTVPLTARRLGNGTSAFKPLIAGTTAWIVDDATGALVAACTVDADATDADLVAERLRGCQPRSGQLLSGQVRVSWQSPPDAAGQDSPIGVRVELASDGAVSVATAPSAALGSVAPPPSTGSCVSEPLKTVSSRQGHRTALSPVPLDTVASGAGAAAETDTGERYLAYRCIAPVAGATPAAGRLRVVATPPSGEASPTPGHRVCLYASAARHGTHPSPGPQNFLVVRASTSCPAGTRLLDPS